ncbi:hypothetical protein [Nocardia sp. Marseille-Q1738]
MSNDDGRDALYGLIEKRDPNPRPVSPKQWADSPHYVEIRTVDGADEVVFSDWERWERSDWP